MKDKSSKIGSCLSLIKDLKEILVTLVSMAVIGFAYFKKAHSVYITLTCVQKDLLFICVGVFTVFFVVISIFITKLVIRKRDEDLSFLKDTKFDYNKNKWNFVWNLNGEKYSINQKYLECPKCCNAMTRESGGVLDDEYVCTNQQCNYTIKAINTAEGTIEATYMDYIHKKYPKSIKYT